SSSIRWWAPAASRWPPAIRSGARSSRFAVALARPALAGRGLVEELERVLDEPRRDGGRIEIAELRPVGVGGDDRLGHRAMAAGAAEIAEVLLHELAGIARVAQVAHRHDERAADQARDDRPLGVF